MRATSRICAVCTKSKRFITRVTTRFSCYFSVLLGRKGFEAFRMPAPTRQRCNMRATGFKTTSRQRFHNASLRTETDSPYDERITGTT